MRNWLRGIAVAAICLYGAICLYMYVTQDSIIYPGGTIDIIPLPDPAQAGLKDFEAVTLDTPDGEHLKAWWHAPEDGHGVVLYLHGNRENLAAAWRVERLTELAATGLGVIGVEYRGFGGSTGHPSEPGLITDAETAFDYAAKQAPGAKIAVFGDSLGTAVAVALATERPVAGLLLDSPFSSARHVAELSYPWLPVTWLLKSPWDSDARIATEKMPIVVATCEEDRKFPAAEGNRLFSAIPADNRNKMQFTFPHCGHVETWTQGAKGVFLTDLGEWTASPVATH
jgi:pimeloyl-ACP methyl ester carboxylesterase